MLMWYIKVHVSLRLSLSTGRNAKGDSSASRASAIELELSKAASDSALGLNPSIGFEVLSGAVWPVGRQGSDGVCSDTGCLVGWLLWFAAGNWETHSSPSLKVGLFCEAHSPGWVLRVHNDLASLGCFVTPVTFAGGFV